jgi:hypothetical protein
MSTLVLTGYNDDYKALGDLTSPLMQQYASRHGYDFKCFRTSAQGVAASWLKIPETRRALMHYERVIWIDADMVITNPEVTFQHHVGIHLSRDWGEDADSDSCFSCGAFMACQTALPMLEKLARKADEFIAKNDMEQNAMRELAKQYPHLFFVHPRRTFNAVHPAVHQTVVDPWQPGDFAAHLTMMPLERRIELFHEITRK